MTRIGTNSDSGNNHHDHDQNAAVTVSVAIADDDIDGTQNDRSEESCNTAVSAVIACRKRTDGLTTPEPERFRKNGGTLNAKVLE